MLITERTFMIRLVEEDKTVQEGEWIIAVSDWGDESEWY